MKSSRVIKRSVLLAAGIAAGRVLSDELPAWYTANRIEFHWENYASNIEGVGGLDGWVRWLTGVHGVIEDSGASVTVACGRGGAEGAWWPTSVGESFAGFGSSDILRDVVVDDYHRRGLKVILYYRHDMDYAMQELHPEWLARHADGSPVVHDRAVTLYGKVPLQMCQNSPFREFTKQRIVEMFRRGADGVYFDQKHMPEVCFCENCQQAFQQKFGCPIPDNPLPGTAEYLEVARFVGQTLADAFAEWKQAVHEVNPQGVLLVASSAYGEFTGIHHTEKMAMAGSANKSEFQKCFGGQQHSSNTDMQKLKTAHPEYWFPARDLTESLEWMINRDVQGGTPPNVWVHRPDATVEGEVLHTAAAVVAHGAVAGMSLPPLKPHVPVYRKLFTMNDALAPFMKDARPYGWVAIHVSNELKERLYVEGGVDAKSRYKTLYDGLYAPVLGVADTLCRAHVPFVTISDTFLEKDRFASETRVLIVPNFQKLSSAVRARIDEIEAERKICVIETTSPTATNGWHLASLKPSLSQSLLSRIKAEAGDSPVFVDGPPNLISTVMINKSTGDLMVSLVRNWDWFWFWNKRPGQIWKEKRKSQPPIRNVKIRADSVLSAEELWPSDTGRNMMLDQSDGITVPDVDIARFVKLSVQKTPFVK